MKKKSRLEILRSKIARSGIDVVIRDDMPEDVAASFIAEMRLCPDCAAAAAQHWKPGPKPTAAELFFANRDGADAIH